MSVLPMGATWSPAIAQSVSNALVCDLGKAWVDNFLLYGKTREEVERKVDIFFERLGRCNVKVDVTQEEMKKNISGTAFTALGVEFDLLQKLYRPYVQKLTVPIPNPTILEAYMILGTLIWDNTIRRKPLFTQPHSMQLMSKLARLACKQGWYSQQRIRLSPAEEAELTKWAIQRNKNAWQQKVVDQQHTGEVWSDASDSVAAYVVFQGNQVLACQAWSVDEHIFLSEMRAAVTGINEARARGVCPKLFCDNLAVVASLSKGAPRRTSRRTPSWLA